MEKKGVSQFEIIINVLVLPAFDFFLFFPIYSIILWNGNPKLSFISMVFNMFFNFPEDDFFRVQQDNG